MTTALQGLADLARDVRLCEGLTAQAAAARQQVAEARTTYETAVVALADELDDVARLESMSLTRILAGLRGSRDTDLDRERAEADAATFTARSAEARLQAAQREVDSLQARIDELGDLAARRGALLVQREAEVAADPSAAATAQRLTAVAAQVGVQEGLLVEIGEAIIACEMARDALSAATRHLSSAGDWATYDTFFGGGMVADLVKHDRLDRAGELMGAADAAMRRLAVELADIEMSGVGGIEITEMGRFFDVWFDNIFSDWAVRDRIREAADRVTTAANRVSQVRLELEGRRGTALDERDALAREREGLLT